MVILGIDSLEPVAEVLKKRFTNMNAMETIKLAKEIIEAINKQLKTDDS